MRLKIDLHLHTCHSFDCNSSVGEVLRWAELRGMDAVAFTDHDSTSAYLDAQKRKSAVRVIPGVEITTSVGTHLLGYFITGPIQSRNILEAIEEIHSQGGLCSLPHPYRRGTGLIYNQEVRGLHSDEDVADVLKEVDMIEAFNAKCSAVDLARTIKFVERFTDKPQTAGSDGHQPFEVGNGYVELLNVESISDSHIKSALLKGGQVICSQEPASPVGIKNTVVELMEISRKTLKAGKGFIPTPIWNRMSSTYFRTRKAIIARGELQKINSKRLRVEKSNSEVIQSDMPIGYFHRAQHIFSGKRIEKHLLNRSQYWSSDEMNEYQLAKLRELLIESSKSVEYYKETFSELGFDPRIDLRSIGDLSRLPILTKSKARELGAKLWNTRDKIRYTIEKTSGSTGEPFTERISYSQVIMEKAFVWRHWTWAEWKFRDKVATVRTYVPKEGEPLIHHDSIRNHRYYSAYHLNEKNVCAYLEDMLAWNPRYLRGYPSSLEILADTASSKQVRLASLKAIFTASETLTDKQREKLTSVFGAEVFDWYGLAEQVVSANECEAHRGLHLNQEYGIWEFEKRPYLAPNERMIIGTNLHNTAMPLVRYETGDIAVLFDEVDSKCSCGRTLPLIKQIRGRKDDILTTIDGRFIPSVNFYSLFREFPAVKRFQLIQRSRQEVELRYVSEHPIESDITAILKQLENRLGSGMKIVLNRNSEFLKNKVGKQRPVISLLPSTPKEIAMEKMES